jgi:predicted site-specific integrase-resolvase
LVEELWSSQQVADFLGITINNLRQIQHRGTIKWVKREWRSVYYNADDVRAYQAKREARKAR